MNRCVTGVVAALIGLAASGCSGSGELGHGNFHYICTSEHDYSCDATAGFRVDAPVAVGASFDLEYLRSNSDSAVRQRLAGVRPASAQVAEQITTAGERGMRFLVSGEGAFLAHGLDGTVLDFVHLFAEQVQEVRLEGDTLSFDNLGMTIGESSRITAYPVGPGRERLIGSMACTWSTDDDSIASMPTESDACSIDVSALASGTTTLHVEMGDAATADLVVVVDDGSAS